MTQSNGGRGIACAIWKTGTLNPRLLLIAVGVSLYAAGHGAISCQFEML